MVASQHKKQRKDGESSGESGYSDGSGDYDSGDADWEEIDESEVDLSYYSNFPNITYSMSAPVAPWTEAAPNPAPAIMTSCGRH